MDLRPDLDIRLERVTTAPHDARRAVRSLLGDVADDDLWQNALLATSEIVTHSLTNGSRSGSNQLSAWFEPTSGWLRVEVTESGGDMPSLFNSEANDNGAGHSEMGGLRLAVLSHVPAAWGVECTAFGTVVWFEVNGRVPLDMVD
ncbi:MAG: hypothetical protein ABIR32_12465 [Ilumatobacteraceae bacterium]